MIRKYAGKNYREGWLVPSDTYENHAFEYITNMIPAWSYENPAVEVKSRTPGLMDQVVEAMQQALNSWVREVQISKVMRDVAVDTCFAWGVAAITMEQVPGHEDEPEPPMWPVVRRVLPTRFFLDPYATSVREARYMGHVWVKHRKDLEEAIDPDTGLPLFNKEVLDEMGNDEGIRDINEAELRQDALSGMYLAKGMVVGYEVWVRETNTIYTLGYGRDNKDGKNLREPRPFVGCPKHGPYHVIGIYTVPGQAYPLSPLAVTADMVQELDAHAGQMKQQAGSAKRLIVVDSNVTADKISMTADGNVIVVPGYKAADTIEFDGPAKANLDYSLILRDRLDRISGLSDLVRGQVDGDATATESQLASQYANVRTRYAQSIFRESVSDILENAAYVMYTDPRVAFYMSIETPAGPQTVAYSGGPWPGQDLARFEHLKLSIDPYSMEWVNEGVKQRQMAEVFDRVLLVGAQAPQLMMNGLDVSRMLDDLGETVNMKGLGKRYLNPAMVQQAAMMQVAAQATATQAAGAEAQAKAEEPVKGNVRSEAQLRRPA
jgi:hypothetical protein